MYKFIFIAHMVMWLSVGIAVSVAVYVTKDIKCLWFLLVPGLCGMKIKVRDDNELQ